MIAPDDSGRKELVDRFADRPTMGAIEPIVGVQRMVDTEPPIDRRGDVARGHRITAGVSPLRVAGAPDRTAGDPATRHQDAVTVRPMVASGLRVDFGGPTEFAHRDDEGRIEQTALIEIIDQGRERSIGRGEEEILVLAFAIDVRVPILALLLVIVNVDERDTGFDEPAGQQQVLATHLAGDAHFATAAVDFTFGGRGRGVSVPLAKFGGLLFDIERPADRVAFEQLVSLVVILAERRRDLGAAP